ncbi:prolactin-releasing peptide isoform X2 [Centrocercus urophasianus]|uniref:prolactin-releasing peptide isoform X2 n=1 Tax=Centrocercus urophasianus TaxID=9002 RepID=UPI001C6544BB|nr:prolactin-releasing peptide isoform X2 [Centrocercus urophasianus]
MGSGWGWLSPMAFPDGVPAAGTRFLHHFSTNQIRVQPREAAGFVTPSERDCSVYVPAGWDCRRLPSRCRGRASGMKLGATCLLCLLLTCMALPAAGRLRVHSMEIRNPDIDPFWYTGRGIRPVGRFGRRRALGESAQPRGAVLHPACIPPHTQPPREQQSA